MNAAAAPAFDFDGGVALALMRGLAVAGLLAFFGALLFRTALAPPVLVGMEGGAIAVFRRRWRGLAWTSWLVAVTAALGWLLLQAAAMADAGTVSGALAATPTVLADTRFGLLLLLRVLLLALAALVLRGGDRRLWIATVVAAAATALQAGHGHAASMYDGPSLLLASEVVHLLAAGAWLGGLLPLLLLVASAAPDTAARASQRFSPFGTACVLLLTATASFQGYVLIDSLAGLFGTVYGWMALIKLAGFAGLLGLAARNRFRLTPALATGRAAMSKSRLCRSIAVEAGLGLLVVLAAGLLTSLPPAMHLQPRWPFPEQLSLQAVREDADFRREVIGAGVALAAALALLVAALLARRLRWPALAVAAVICWFAVPHLDLLLVEAYPTSFYRSPTGFAATAIVEGDRLFRQHCAVCHGAEGRGDGPAAKGLPIPPADLTAEHLWMHSDGELFWWLSHGIDAPDGGTAMPGFAAVLSDEQRWDLIDYVRAHNAGTTMSRAGNWSPPIQAPGLQATCGDTVLALRDLRGRFVRLVIGPSPPVGVEPDVVTVLAAASAPAGLCFTDDLAVSQAYAVVAGIPPGELLGTQFLIDDRGWLRALQRPGKAGGWDEPNALAAEIRDLRAHPLTAVSGSDGPMDMRHMDMRM